MKKILALTLCCVMFISSSICVFAAEQTQNSQVGSPSIDRIIEELEEMRAQNEELSRQIAELTKAVKARGSSGGGGNSRPTPAPSSNSNYVNFGGTVTYQGGRVEINGGRSNATLTIKAPGSGVITSANTLAGKLGGSLVSCINASAPGVNFKTAKVNFYVGGVADGENIAAYQNQGGTWVQLPVAEVRQDHVVVNITRLGDIAFIRVPALASITG
ncbi:hypothetical protein D6855_05560 [Butyrivibrio sp. CB08]|uniref:hypothetical protein n=1 Tax=Butyrivibrio sp. CB08 TaxID=2364879 RepID=UPI000EA83EC7|nr:hypothetical protein [Butyrivibrio sp. CB08]RKM61358.1 hypothetical protein D6855_05560 [Butyrivibrio sp. CB08]